MENDSALLEEEPGSENSLTSISALDSESTQEEITDVEPSATEEILPSTSREIETSANFRLDANCYLILLFHVQLY